MIILRDKNFSRKSPEDTTIRIGHIKNKQKLGDLSDKQLKNIARWDGGLTKKEKQNVKKTYAGVIVPSAIVGGLIGNSCGGAKNTAIGSAIGTAVGTGIVAMGDRMHKKQAIAAKKVLENRKKK